jgi:hypothetical protein
MNEIITCPACQNKVQVPDEFLGRAVQCPECQHAFVAGGAAVRSPANALFADPGDPMPASRPPRALEPLTAPRRPRYAVDEEGAEPYDDWGRRHGMLRPDRGGMILAFGILTVVTPCLGLILGPMAWFMGSADLAAIDSGEMNPANRGLVQAGRIIGAIGFLMEIFKVVAFVAWMVFVFSTMRH